MYRQYGEVELVKFEDLIESVIGRYRTCKVLRMEDLIRHIRWRIITGLSIHDPGDWVKKTRQTKRLYYRYFKGV